MTGFVDALKEAYRDAICSQVSNQPTWFSNLRRLVVPETFRDFADNVSRRICDRPVDDNDFPKPDFVGGQCAVSYQFRGDAFNQNTGAFLGNFPYGFFMGPLSIRRVSPAPTCDPSTLVSTPQTFLVHAGGEFELVTAQCTAFSPIGAFQAVREDGQPDNCGDGPINLPPPGPITIFIDIDYGPNNEFNLAVPVIFAPVYVALDGSLNIDFNIPEINLNGTLKLNPSFEVNLNLGGNFDPGSPDNPTLPGADPGADGEDDPAGPAERIIGVMVRVTELNEDKVTIIPQAVGPSVVAPRAATVKFLGRFGGATGWTPDIAVKSVRSYVPCPIPSGAVDVQVTGDFGSQVVFTPIRGKPLTDFN